MCSIVGPSVNGGVVWASLWNVRMPVWLSPVRTRAASRGCPKKGPTLRAAGLIGVGVVDGATCLRDSRNLIFRDLKVAKN